MSTPPTDLSRLRIDRDRPSAPRGRGRLGVLIALGVVTLAWVVLMASRGRASAEVKTAMAEFQSAGAGGATQVTASGYVVARTKASISSKIAGRLDYLGVTEGQQVAKGDVIARLENADYQASLRAEEASVALARADLQHAKATRDQLKRDVGRQDELLRDKLISDQEAERMRSELAQAEARVASADAQIDAAEARVQVARANLENTVIRAPFDATVLRKEAEVGELVAPSMSGGGLTRGAVVTLADLGTLEVEVDVNESYIANIKDGQPSRIVLDAYRDASFRGEVRQVMPTADRQRATVQVKVSILDRDPRILPEMAARVEFLGPAEPQPSSSTPAPARIWVPADGVRDESGQSVVWIVVSGKLERRPVEAGPVSGGRREIRSGLSGGESVVVEGPERLEPGMKVKVAAAP